MNVKTGVQKSAIAGRLDQTCGHVDFEALADGVDAAAPRPSAEIIDGEPERVAKFSDREIFEKYKAGRAIIAAGIMTVEEFNAERPGPLVTAEIIDSKPAGPTFGIVRAVIQT